MRITTTTAAAAIAVALIGISAASAQEAVLVPGRENPFVPPPDVIQEQQRVDERLRTIVRDMTPEISARIMQETLQSIAATEVRLRRDMEAKLRDTSETPTAEEDSDKPGEPKASPKANSAIPEGSTFISCINGKALYRGTDGFTFQIQGNNTSSPNPCAR